MVASKVLNRLLLIAVFSLLLFSFVTPAQAQTEDSYAVNAAQKLGRGLINVATGWVEIPKNIINTTRDSNVGIGLTWGLVKGIGNTLGRTLVGAGELATFFIPFPETELIQPTYVFENFYRDTTYGVLR